MDSIITPYYTANKIDKDVGIWTVNNRTGSRIDIKFKGFSDKIFTWIKPIINENRFVYNFDPYCRIEVRCEDEAIIIRNIAGKMNNVIYEIYEDTNASGIIRNIRKSKTPINFISATTEKLVDKWEHNTKGIKPCVIIFE